MVLKFRVLGPCFGKIKRKVNVNFAVLQTNTGAAKLVRENKTLFAFQKLVNKIKVICYSIK